VADIVLEKRTTLPEWLLSLGYLGLLALVALSFASGLSGDWMGSGGQFALGVVVTITGLAHFLFWRVNGDIFEGPGARTFLLIGFGWFGSGWSWVVPEFTEVSPGLLLLSLMLFGFAYVLALITLFTERPIGLPRRAGGQTLRKFAVLVALGHVPIFGFIIVRMIWFS
jgi:hypothetical protein